jgi:hypothetical protein
LKARLFVLALKLKCSSAAAAVERERSELSWLIPVSKQEDKH